MHHCKCGAWVTRTDAVFSRSCGACELEWKRGVFSDQGEAGLLARRLASAAAQMETENA